MDDCDNDRTESGQNATAGHANEETWSPERLPSNEQGAGGSYYDDGCVLLLHDGHGDERQRKSVHSGREAQLRMQWNLNHYPPHWRSHSIAGCCTKMWIHQRSFHHSGNATRLLLLRRREENRFQYSGKFIIFHLDSEYLNSQDNE